MIHRRYLAAGAIFVVAWGALFLAFTWIIDPYGVSPVRVHWDRINRFKPKRLDIDRLIKPYEVWRRQPRTVFLGTSRILQSMNPSALDGTGYAPAYNASIPASSLGMNASHLRQYVELNPRLRTVVVELFLYNFLGQGQEHAPKTLAEYVGNTATLFVSADVLWASIQTLVYNLWTPVPCYEIKPRGYFYYPPGHDAKGTFDGYPAGIWRQHEGRRNGLRLHEPAFEALREIVALGRTHGLDVIFVVTPNHAYDDYYLDAVHAWSTVEEWLIRVTSAAPVVYSFSQPNAWVYEPVSSRMRYWNDPYHFSIEMGQGMQQALAGSPGRDTPDDFMVRLSPEGARAHVASRKAAIGRWAAQNPDFVAAFRDERRKWEMARPPERRLP